MPTSARGGNDAIRADAGIGPCENPYVI